MCAASGSIEIMAIELAKNSGGIVTSVFSEKNFELVKPLGSYFVNEYKEEDDELGLETCKYVSNAAGNSKSSTLKEKSKKALSPKCKYISIDGGTP